MIASELISYKNRNGKTIVGYLDRSDKNNRDFIVIPPAFGETKRDALKLSYFLAKNGFSVIRYDATDHIGESQGEMTDATFDTMKLDLISALDFIQSCFNVSRTGVAGTSLGIRVAIKAAAEDQRIGCICGIVPIVDLRTSITAIYHQDIIGEIMDNRYSGKTIDDIMGFEVSIDFALSAIKDSYHDLDSTRRDMDKISVPVAFLSAENDPWINAGDARSLCDGITGREFVLIPAAMHQINENPEAALFALKQAVVRCKRYLRGEEIQPDKVLMPEQAELQQQWLIEESRLRNLLQKSLEGEKEFWEKYLNKFVLIHKSVDYRSLLSDISDELGVDQGERALDAGCGNGDFGAWLMERMVDKLFREKIRQDQFRPVAYYGLDFIEKSLKEAELKNLNFIRRLYRELSLRDRYPLIKYSYVLADLEQRLPFDDGHFDKICCNLVLSYVSDPQFSLRELCRVLKPGGKIIISSLKPYADLSQIYRNFADMTENQEELKEARKLLSAAGRIKQKEDAGIYTFFFEEELKKLLQNAGIGIVTVKRTFGGQANFISGRKE